MDEGSCGQWVLGMAPFIADPSDAEVFRALFVGIPPWLRYTVVSSTVIGSERAIIITQLGFDFFLLLIAVPSDGRQVST